MNKINQHDLDNSGLQSLYTNTIFEEIVVIGGNSQFNNCEFRGGQLTFKGAVIENCTFDNCVLTLPDCEINQAKIEKCKIRSSRQLLVYNSEIRGGSFSGIIRSAFVNSELKDIQFTDTVNNLKLDECFCDSVRFDFNVKELTLKDCKTLDCKFSGDFTLADIATSVFYNPKFESKRQYFLGNLENESHWLERGATEVAYTSAKGTQLLREETAEVARRYEDSPQDTLSHLLMVKKAKEVVYLLAWDVPTLREAFTTALNTGQKTLFSSGGKMYTMAKMYNKESLLIIHEEYAVVEINASMQIVEYLKVDGHSTLLNELI